MEHTVKRATVYRPLFFKGSLVALIFVLLFCGSAYSDQSCSCVIPEFDRQLRIATFIFTGKVAAIEYSEGKRVVRFQVSDTWKGRRQTAVTITTPLEEDDCGYVFEANETYLVYAKGEDPFSTDACTRTKLLKNAKDDERILRSREQSSRESKAAGRDPFNPMKGERFESQKQPAVRRTLNITNAVIVGIVKRGNDYMASIRGADGRVYTMREGDRLYDGKILKIDSRSVTFGQYSGQRMKEVKKRMHPFDE